MLMHEGTTTAAMLNRLLNECIRMKRVPIEWKTVLIHQNDKHDLDQFLLHTKSSAKFSLIVSVKNLTVNSRLSKQDSEKTTVQ